MARATQAASEATAATILATARRLYTEHGYAAVSLEQIAAEAGVTRGAIYHHYGNRLGLFTAVHTDVAASVEEAILHATEGVHDTWHSLELGSRAFLRASVADDARQIMLLDGPAVLGWAQWRQTDAAHSARQLDDVLQQLANEGTIAVASVPAASALLSGAMNEAVLWIAEANDRETALAEAWHTLALLLGSLRQTLPHAAQTSQGTLNELPDSIGKVARRELEATGYTSYAQLNGASRKKLLAIHGVGPKAISLLEAELTIRGMAFDPA